MNNGRAISSTRRSTSTKPGAFDRLNWARDQEVNNPTRKAVLFALVSYSKPDGYVWAKQRTIAKVAECTRQTANGHLQELKREGKIDMRRQYRSDGSRRDNEYLLLFRHDVTWPDGSAPDMSGGLTHSTHDASEIPTHSDENMSDISTAHVGNPDGPRRPSRHIRSERVENPDSSYKKEYKKRTHKKSGQGDLVSVGSQDEDCSEDHEPSPAKETPLERMQKLRTEAAEQRASDSVQPADPSEDIVPDKMDASARKA